jgi:hypothetical protein
VHEDDLTCNVKALDDDIEYTNVRLSVSSKSDSTNIPIVGGTVIINFLNEENAYVVKSDISSKYKISVSDDQGVEVASLKQVLLAQNEAIKSYIESINIALSNATFKHPYGPTLPIPINKAEFDNTKDTFDSGISDVDDLINLLFRD